MNNILKINPLTIGREAILRSGVGLGSALNLNPGFLLAIMANILWGASFLASKYTLQAWGPFTASSLRFGIATIALYAVITFLGKRIDIPRNTGEWLGVLLIGTSAFGLLYPMQLAGLKYISSSVSAAIMLMSPLLVLAFGKVVLKEKLTLSKWISLFLGLIGGSILLFSHTNLSAITFSSDFLFGSFLTLSSAACLAISVIFTRKYSKDFSSTSLTFWTMAIGFLELTIAAFVFEENVLANLTTNTSLISWVALIFLSLVCSAFCFFIWNAALAKTSPQEIASSMHIKTPTAVLIGVLIANEVLSTQILLGTTLVMAGVWLSQQNNYRSTK